VVLQADGPSSIGITRFPKQVEDHQAGLRGVRLIESEHGPIDWPRLNPGANRDHAACGVSPSRGPARAAATNGHGRNHPDQQLSPPYAMGNQHGSNAGHVTTFSGKRQRWRRTAQNGPQISASDLGLSRQPTPMEYRAKGPVWIRASSQVIAPSERASRPARHS